MKMEMKQTAANRLRFNDIGFRLITIPLCGIAIPIITGMVNTSGMSHWQIKLSFLYTIGIAWIIFEGNRFLSNTLRSYFDWHNKPWHKIIALLIVHPTYTVPVSGLLLISWYLVFRDGDIDWSVVRLATAVILVCVIFIVHIYETVFLVKEAESESILRAEMDKARVQAELDALKNQIDPHFMFNSLNTLSSMIAHDPDKAVAFNENLADVYRYILHGKSRDLVLLEEELSFLDDYLSLMKIRFGDAIAFTMKVPDAVRRQYLIPPITLQIPAENAIKHNEFSTDDPLQLKLDWKKDGRLVFSNNYHPKELLRPSSGIGLENLINRYRLLTGRDIAVRNDRQFFSVEFPLIPVQS